MPTRISESFVIESDGTEVELFVNAQNNIFCSPTDYEESARFWFTITKEDWKELKEFIDGRLET